MRPKLQIVAAGYPSEGSFAGAFHRDQFRLIAEGGFDVTVVVPTPWMPKALLALRPQGRAYSDAPRTQIDGAVTIYRPRYPTVPQETRRAFPDLAQYLAIRALRLPRPDIVQGFYGFPNGAAARRMARHWNVPYLVGLLGDDVNLYPEQRARNRRVLSRTIRDAAFAFANGETLAATASHIAGVPVPNLPIGVDATRFENLPSREAARAALGLPAGRHMALYVGSLSNAKGTAELAGALSQLHDLPLSVVAIGDGPLRQRLAAEPNAILLGVRPATEVALAMAAADFLVHPSYSEGLPIALVEAGFAGLPIVTTQARGCIDIGRDGRAVIVPVADALALEQAMRSAVADPAAMRAHADVMLAHVRQNYSMAMNTEKLMAHYRRCLSGAPAGAS